MAFGRRKPTEQPVDEPGSAGAHRKPQTPIESPAPHGADGGGPFDIEDFDDAAAASEGRLDLGSVLLPLPESAQLQVELTEVGVPSAVWVVTANGRFTVAAYAAPKTGGLWREIAGELAESLRKDGAEVSIQDGRWGREVVGTASGVVRFIGVDGYRWMIRCVVNGTPDSVELLTEEARESLLDTVIRRGDTPLPVRTPLPVQLPEPMASQLREAAASHGAEGGPEAGPEGGGADAPPDPAIEAGEGEGSGEEPPTPTARRSASGSAMQQLRGTGG
jgi:Protein of unknown function (DUF3710)